MAEHNVNTVKAQIQRLINKANETTGNTDTNLTDGVNALVSGYGQGGIQLPEDMLEGLENGYDVMFYDENSKGLAFYSIKSGHAINPPVYSCKNWQDANGGIVTFPYTPSANAIFYANNNTYASMLYQYYGIDSAVYPYICIDYLQSTNKSITVCFFKTHGVANGCENNITATVTLDSVLSYSSLEELLELVMYHVPADSTFESTYVYMYDNSSHRYCINFDKSSFTKTTIYRLDVSEGTYVPQDMNQWTKNTPSRNAYKSITYTQNNGNVCQYYGAGGHEVIAYPLLLKANTTYEFSLEYSTISNIVGEYEEPYKPYIAFIKGNALLLESNPVNNGNTFAHTLMTTGATNGFITYKCEYTPSADGVVYVGLVTGCTLDGVNVEFTIKNVKLETR